MKPLSVFPAATLLLACTALARAEVAAVNPSVSEVHLTAERVRDILLGRVTTWVDGSPVIIVLADDPADDLEVVAITGRDRQRLVRGWKRLVYAGNGAMPLQVSSHREALATVAAHPGAIALVATAEPGSPWKAIAVEH